MGSKCGDMKDAECRPRASRPRTKRVANSTVAAREKEFDAVFGSFTNASERTNFILRNMDYIQQYGAQNSRMTVELKRKLAERNTPHLIRGYLTECPKCHSRQSMVVIEKRSNTKQCTVCEYITEGAPERPEGGCIGHHSAFSSAEVHARPRSVYLPASHMTDWLGRLTGTLIPAFNPTVIPEIEKRLKVRGLLHASPDDAVACRKLASYTFWFELLKHPVDYPNSVKVNIFYYHISYFIRCYSPAPVSMPVFTGPERQRIMALFLRALEVFYRMKKHIAEYEGRRRKNFWSYGLFLAHVLQEWGERGQEFLRAYPDQLRLSHIIDDVQQHSGRLFHRLWYTLRTERDNQDDERERKRKRTDPDTVDDQYDDSWCGGDPRPCHSPCRRPPRRRRA